MAIILLRRLAARKFAMQTLWASGAIWLGKLGQATAALLSD